MSATALGPGQLIADRYRVEELLGEGGMGSVYRATQLSLGRAVAVKVIADAEMASAHLVERFEREARALARLAHPHTVRLFDFGLSDGKSPFLVMELLSGRDLAERLRTDGPMGWRDALAVCVQVLRALEEAHEAGIVHRDIKPANIFLCKVQGQELFAKVLDFGISGLTRSDE